MKRLPKGWPTGPLEPELSREQLEALVVQVMADHLERKTLCQIIPLKRRGKNPHRTPKTAVIGKAARRAIAARELAEGRGK